MRRTDVIWAVCLTSLLCNKAVAASDLTVSGIALGDSLSSAEAKIGPSYKVTALPSQQPNNPISTAIAVNVSQTDAYEFGAIDGKLWFVRHVSTYADDKEPNTKSLLASLVTKFGPPNRDVSAMGHPPNTIDVVWSFDKNGGLPRLPISDISPHGQYLMNLVAVCANAFNFTSASPESISQSQSQPREFQPVCNKVVKAVSEGDQNNNQLTKSFSLSIANMGQMYRQLTISKSEAEKRKNDAAEKAKSNVPNL